MGVRNWLSRHLAESVLGNSGQHTPYANVPNLKNSPHYDGQLDATLEHFAKTLGKSDDYMVRVVQVNGAEGACIFIDSVVDPKNVQQLLRAIHTHRFPRRQPKNLAQYLIEQVVEQSDAIFMTNLFEMAEAITSGSVVLLVDGVSPAIVVGAEGIGHRKPEEPSMESSSRGSQVGFVENVDINLGLIRRALTTDTLTVRKLRVGYRSRTQVAIAYLDDIANPVLVNTVLERVQSVHTDTISQSSAVEQRIIDRRWTMFPLMRVTQRVDSVSRELNQGKVVVVVDGDSSVLMAPCTLMDFFQTEEDYAHSPYEATYIRLLRIVSFVFALFLPALYVSFVDFNPELLPKTLGLQIAKSREGIPFPAVTEVMVMLVLIEILREATLRMPKQMGQTIGIVGGIVVGEASVQAGLVSNVLVIVVSLTAISAFVTPSYEFATVIRLSSWLMLLGSALFGFYGVLLVTIFFLFHVSSLKSFGISFLDPFTGEHTQDALVDGLIRLPVWMMDKRTEHLHPIDSTGGASYKEKVPHPQLEKQSSARPMCKRKRGRMN